VEAQAILERLQALGILVDVTTAFSSLASALDISKGAARITNVSIFTKNRPEALAKCINTYARNCTIFGHECDFTLWDDSPGRETQALNRSIARTVSSALSIRVRYVDINMRQHFCRHLFEAGIPKTVCEFALLPSPISFSTGANRNVALLDNLDRLSLFVDDDTTASCAVHPRHHQGLGIGGVKDPRDFEFFSSRLDAARCQLSKNIDIIGNHERLLGKALNECLAERNGDVQFRDPCAHMLADDSSLIPHIAITMPGKLGDCGRSQPLWVVSALGRIRSYDNMIGGQGDLTRDVLECAPCDFIVHGLPCMAMVLGVDGRLALPPFSPHFRNEDGVFGALLTRIIANSAMGIVNYAAFHNSEPERRYANNDQARFSDLLISIVNSQSSMLRSPSSNIQLLARYFMEIAAQEEREIEVLCREWLASHYIAWLNNLYVDNDDMKMLPKAVSTYFDSQAHKIYSLVTRRELNLPIEFCSSKSSDWEQFRIELRKMGELLLWWEDMKVATKTLKDKGIKLSSMENDVF